jgi:hypothetical protein
MLANAGAFGIEGARREELEQNAYDAASEVKKSEFALDQALKTETWNIPLYIREGLAWLEATSLLEQPGDLRRHQPGAIFPSTISAPR